jgi:hypothetical protein
MECTYGTELWRVCLSVINLLATSLTLTVWRGMIGLQLIWTGCGRKRPYRNLIYCHGMCLEKGMKNISQGIRYPGRNSAAVLEALPIQFALSLRVSLTCTNWTYILF